MIEPIDLMLIAFFMGIGNALSQPVAEWLTRKIMKHKKRILENLKNGGDE
jgi:hypothetical protein